ncbi:MAG TPA: PEP-CTERM sorting domain-containing protein, partial [Planctomycetota bacterium]|nr:PEP-CTERM sorting domain-containing protein [Planctomycetota bacterium]
TSNGYAFQVDDLTLLSAADAAPASVPEPSTALALALAVLPAAALLRRAESRARARPARGPWASPAARYVAGGA